MIWHVMLFNVMLVISCGYALTRGGPPERIVGASLLVAAFATAMSFSPLASRFLDLEARVLVIDTILLIILTMVAVRAEEPDISAEALRYINRLSDLLFVLARVANSNGAKDVLWQPGRYTKTTRDSG